MSVKKLSFYLIQANVLLKSDHLPLKRFLHKNTLNSKVINWAMELESFNIWFGYIKGQNNYLADTLSCLIDIYPDTQLTTEGKGMNLVLQFLRNFQIFTLLRLIKSLQVTRKSRMIQTFMIPYSASTT